MNAMPDMLQRLRSRRLAPLAVLAVSAGLVVLGAVGFLWAVAGVAAVIAWAALWPHGTTTEALPAEAPAPSLSVGDGRAATIADLPLSVLDGLPDAALLLDTRGRIIAANSAAATLSTVVPGRPLSHWTRAPELLAAVEGASSSGSAQRCSVRQYAPVERLLDVRVTPVQIAGQTGPQPLLVILRDLTEQEQLSRMRADFVANASHELRTPLASLRGFVETLQGAARNDPAAQTRFLAIMQTQAERMSRLIDDLLSLSRIEMREHVVPTAAVDLASVAQDTVSALRPMADEAGITIQMKDITEPMRVIGDRDELGQVAHNLIQNAIKYGRTGGSVGISLAREGSSIVLQVRDDGIGIPAEHVPRLTERFYRVSAKESKERGGTGLGLAIVKHIVNRHRGELGIASTPGEGSTFSVALPAAAGERQVG